MPRYGWAMAISTAIGLWIPRARISPGQLAPIVGAGLPARRYFTVSGRKPLEPRGRGWRLAGEVRVFHVDPGDAPPELLQTGDYEVFDALPPAPARPKRKPTKKKRRGR